MTPYFRLRMNRNMKDYIYISEIQSVNYIGTEKLAKNFLAEPTTENIAMPSKNVKPSC